MSFEGVIIIVDVITKSLSALLAMLDLAEGLEINLSLTWLQPHCR